MFYFEQLLQTALSGIDSTNIMTTVLQVASTILLLSFLYSAYQAFASGGDVRMLAVSSVKYLVLGLVFASYGTIFRAITGMFNSVADFIFSSTGVGDVFSNWMGQLANYWEAQGWSSIWGLITGGISGLLSAIIIIVGFIVYPIAYLLFTVFYALFGSVLYVVGPFVLALLPTRGIGELARTYAVNVMIFGSWGLIYAIIQVLMSAINLNSIDAVLNANGVLNSFIGSGSMILLAIVSVLFSISIALIPYFASRIVRGDVGSTMFALAGTAATAASAAASLAGKALTSGGSGYGSATHKSDGPPPPPPGGEEVAEVRHWPDTPRCHPRLHPPKRQGAVPGATVVPAAVEHLHPPHPSHGGLTPDRANTKSSALQIPCSGGAGTAWASFRVQGGSNEEN